jgi:hypothetical protein
VLQTGTADQEDRIERSSLESQTSEVVPFETIDGTSLHEGSDVDDLSLEHSSLKLYFECEIFEQDSECLEVMTKVQVMTRSKVGNIEEDCLVVISNINAYFFRILQPSFVEPASWIGLSSKQPLNSLIYIEIGPDYQFLFVDFTNCAYLLLFRDYLKCKDFSDRLPVIVSDTPNSSLLGIKVSDITLLSLWYAVNAPESCPVEAYVGLHCYYAIGRTTDLMKAGRCIDGNHLLKWMTDHLQMSEPPQVLCQKWLDINILSPSEDTSSQFDENQSYIFNVDKWVKTKFDFVMQAEQKFFMCSSFQGLETSTGIVSIFVEDEAMCLLDDNCAQWPLSKLARVALAGIQTPPYKLIARKPITDISSLSLHQKDRKVVLEFFDDVSRICCYQGA